MEKQNVDVITKFSEEGRVIPVRIREYNIKEVRYDTYDIEKIFYMEDLGDFKNYSVSGNNKEFILQFSVKSRTWKKRTKG